MHTITPARLKPGTTIADLPAPVAQRASTEAERALISGRALVFWDPKAPAHTKKLDAIDTDQITPVNRDRSRISPSTTRQRVFLTADSRKECWPVEKLS